MYERNKGYSKGYDTPMPYSNDYSSISFAICNNIRILALEGFDSSRY
jgi:hypothetical protein